MSQNVSEQINKMHVDQSSEFLRVLRCDLNRGFCLCRVLVIRETTHNRAATDAQ